MVLKIGLTGGIGSGKTLVSDYLKNLGIKIIDTDEISRELTCSGGDAMNGIRKIFGKEALNKDGSLNRIWMRNKIFLNNSDKEKLEKIIHPLITKRAVESSNDSNGSYMVFVVPLLLESGNWIDKVDRICVVDCSTYDQIARVKNRDNINEELIEKIINSQLPRYVRLKYADDIIHNEGEISIDELYEQILIKHEKWTYLSKVNQY